MFIGAVLKANQREEGEKKMVLFATLHANGSIENRAFAWITIYVKVCFELE